MNHAAAVFKTVTGICAICLLVGGTGCVASDKNTIAQASAFDTGLKPAQIQGAQTNEYLQQIGQRIIAAAKELDKEKIGPREHFKEGDNSWMFQDIRFQLVNSKTLNAFTTGGHFVYIYLELFKMCKTEEEIAAVMAHEYGHIYCRHVQKGSGRQQALALASAGAGVAGKAAGVESSDSLVKALQAGGGFIDMGFTRKDEAQADQFGLKFYTRAGWDPAHFADFFQAMIAAGYDKGSAMTSAHPTLASRVEATKKDVSEQNPQRVAQYRKPPIADPKSFENLKQQAIQVAQGLPDDQKVLQAKNLLQALPRSCWIPYEPDDQKQAQQAIVDQAQKQQAQQPKPQ